MARPKTKKSVSLRLPIGVKARLQVLADERGIPLYRFMADAIAHAESGYTPLPDNLGEGETLPEGTQLLRR